MGSLRNIRKGRTPLEMSQTELRDFMRAGSPHSYYGTLYEAYDLGLLHIPIEELTLQDQKEIIAILGPKRKSD
jgi:hypothetical protein